MNNICSKMIYLSWFIVCLFGVFLFVSLSYMSVSYLLFIPTFLLFVLYMIITVKYLRCPNCGKPENLNRLTRGINHKIYCSKCGEKIEISK